VNSIRPPQLPRCQENNTAETLHRGGNWLSRDPLPAAELSQGANLYWYVSNNAVNKVDLEGLNAGETSVDQVIEYFKQKVEQQIDEILDTARSCVGRANCKPLCLDCLRTALPKIKSTVDTLLHIGWVACLILAEDPPAVGFCWGLVEQSVKSAASSAVSTLNDLKTQCERLPG
jgi:hypothetical protein